MNYYTEYWASDNLIRNKEVIDCINKNIESKLFNNVFVFSEKKENSINTDIILSERITYQRIFDNSVEGINIFANSDIEFDETINLALNIQDNEFYALTRYESDGKLHKHDDSYRGFDSQDTWIWKNDSKIKNIKLILLKLNI